jgi:hypothetical protein
VTCPGEPPGRWLWQGLPEGAIIEFLNYKWKKTNYGAGDNDNFHFVNIINNLPVSKKTYLQDFCHILG